MFLARKKAWRRLKNKKRARQLRCLLVGMLFLELAFFLREAGLSRWVRFTNVEQVQIGQESEEKPGKEQEASKEKVYGIQFHPGKGSLDFYWNELIVEKNEKGLVSEE